MDEVKTDVNNVEMTAGEILRNARTTGRRKREISTVAKQLCIREEFLQALEDGNYALIPEVVYILGFARNYAMELGLNPDEIVHKIKREMGLIVDSSDDDDDAEEPVAGGAVAQKKDFKGAVKHAIAFVKRHWIWFVGALVALAAVVGVAVALLMKSSEPVEVTPAPDVPTVATIMEPKFTVPVRERFGAENREKSDIVLQAVRGSWVKVEDARGRTEFSRVLVEGDVYYVPTKGKYKATFGDAGGIDIWVEGKLAPKAGADHVRKSDIALNVESLMKEPKAADKADVKPESKAEKSDKAEAKADKKVNDAADGNKPDVD